MHAIRKRAYVSLLKSFWMVFGPLPAVVPTLRLGAHAVELVKKIKFNGIWLSSYTNNIFELNYTHYASKARRAMDALFALRHRIGSIPVSIGILLYMARIDCYLICAADIAIDVDDLVEELEEIQHEFLRRLLGVGERSMLAPLFTETGVLPIRACRVILALKCAVYLCKLEDNRTPRHALLDGLDLWMHGFSSWAMTNKSASYHHHRRSEERIFAFLRDVWDSKNAGRRPVCR
jgi:hypothetical protein